MDGKVSSLQVMVLPMHGAHLRQRVHEGGKVRAVKGGKEKVMVVQFHLFDIFCFRKETTFKSARKQERRMSVMK